MDFGIYSGDTNATIYVRLRDSTTGLAKTGLAFGSAGAVCSYVLPGAARVAITLATQTVTGAHSDGGFVEVDATDTKGLYRLDLTDAAIASGNFTLISIEFDGTIEETVVVPLHTRRVNVTQLGGVVQSLTDLKDFADAGYDPATNKVQGVVLVDTLTTYTGNTVQTGDSFSRLGAPAGATISADLLVIDNFVDGIETAVITNAAGVNIAADIIALKAETVLIVEDTNELQTDNVPGLIATAQDDLDTITGADGVTLATAQGNYAPSTATALTSLVTTVGVAGAGLTDLGGMSSGMQADINTQVDGAFTTQMADSVPADGTISTREQALYAILQLLTDFAISGTTMTVRKVDGSTALMTLTLNDATSPTSITRAT